MNNCKKRIIIAYACEDAGSEPGVGFYWTKTLANVYKDDETILITRKNNNTDSLNISKTIGIDLNSPFLKIKTILGTRIYYLIWSFLVFIHLLVNYKTYKGSIVHHITFTPIYYPPIYFILPFNFIWGPIGGGETYPVSYLKNMKIIDILKETIRFFLKYSIYINPLFYFGCKNSSTIICSTSDTAALIPNRYKNKTIIELMVFDEDKHNDHVSIKKDIVIANRLINWKMTHLFVEAFYTYNKDYSSDYRLLIIGDGPYFKYIEKYIDNEKIIHIKRFEKRTDMLSILQNSSLFVSMSLRDSGAASLLEAISYGIPFLVTDSCAHKVFLEQNIGFSFTLENFNTDKIKIVKLLKSILENEEILINERKKIISVYDSYFSEDGKAKRIYEKLNRGDKEYE